MRKIIMKSLKKKQNKFKVDNAIILAAGTASRFAPLSYERHKALIEVKGEVLIERQIRQLLEAGIKEIIIVTGYKSEQFDYLVDKYGVILVKNNNYLHRNNNESIYVARKYIKNSYICSSDNYFSINPFNKEEECSYYSALYSKGKTNEWCLSFDKDGVIKDVHIGGSKSWYMLGHTFWDINFSKKFIEILEKEYDLEETVNKLWENIYIEHISELKMKIKKYKSSDIFEFDTLDELREFDNSYINNTRSEILKSISSRLNCLEKDLTDIHSFNSKDNSASGFSFLYNNKKYRYYYESQLMEETI